MASKTITIDIDARPLLDVLAEITLLIGDGAGLPQHIIDQTLSLRGDDLAVFSHAPESGNCLAPAPALLAVLATLRANRT